MKSFALLALVFASAPITLATPISKLNNDLVERARDGSSAVTVCTGIDREGECMTSIIIPFDCHNLSSPYTNGVSSIRMYKYSKCKFYKELDCSERTGFKQLMVNKITSVRDWNTKDIGMDNEVKSIMCFPFDGWSNADDLY